MAGRPRRRPWRWPPRHSSAKDALVPFETERQSGNFCTADPSGHDHVAHPLETASGPPTVLGSVNDGRGFQTEQQCHHPQNYKTPPLSSPKSQHTHS